MGPVAPIRFAAASIRASQWGEGTCTVAVEGFLQICVSHGITSPVGACTAKHVLAKAGPFLAGRVAINGCKSAKHFIHQQPTAFAKSLPLFPLREEKGRGAEAVLPLCRRLVR